MRAILDGFRVRVRAVPAWVLVTQLFIGLGWMRAGFEKLISASWWSGATLQQFLIDHEGQAVWWYESFLDEVVIAQPALIIATVVVAQFMAGVALLSGREVGAGLTVGIFLNLHFLAAGAVNPSAFYLLSQGSLALWMIERQRSERVERRLLFAAVIAVVAGLASLPSIGTIMPSEVVDDPAIMFATIGALTATATWAVMQRSEGLASNGVFGRGGPVAVAGIGLADRLDE